MGNEMHRALYSTEDLSEMSGLPLETIRGLYRKGEIAGQKIGKRIFFSADEVQRILQVDDKSARYKHLTEIRTLEIENQSLRNQINALKGILASASSILE